MLITQKELLEKQFKADGREIFGRILRPGLYVLAGTSKVSKSMIATTMANCIAKGKDFLGKSMPQGKVIYFDNDNYDFETKNRIISLNLSGIDEVLYEFDESKSIEVINEPRDILFLINTVVSEQNHILKGTCQEIVQKSRMEINSSYFTKFLKLHQHYLDENNVTFKNERTGKKRMIIIEYHNEDI